MSLWDKEVLLKLLSKEESAWEFEYNSPKRSKAIDGFYVVNKSFFKYKNVIIKGFWHPRELRWLKNNFPNISTENRNAMTIHKSFTYDIKSFFAKKYYKVINLILKRLKCYLH